MSKKRKTKAEEPPKPALLDKPCDITDFADCESTRYALGGVYFDADNRVLAATDSRMLAVVSLPDVSPDVIESMNGDVKPPPSSCVIPLAIIKKCLNEISRRPTKRSKAHAAFAKLSEPSPMSVTVEAERDGSRVSREGVKVEGRFPRYADVIPRPEDLPTTIRVDPSFLRKACDYFAKHGSGEYGTGITLRIGTEEQPMRIEGTLRDGRSALIVLMPLKSDI